MAEIAKKSTPRKITIRKRDDFDGYGFNLHAEKGKPGQYVGKVDADSPAELSGLREGDRIIEVNGIDIGSETHKQVVERIKAVPHETTLLVIDPHSFSLAKNGSMSPVAKKEEKQVEKNQQSMNNNNNDATTDSDNKKIGTKDNSAVSANATTTTTDNNNTKVANATVMISETTESTKTETGNHHVNNHHTKKTTTMTTTETPAENNNHDKNHENNSNQANGKQQHTESKISNGSSAPALNLNMTATELRAKLMAKKKYDPKNDSIDLRKKYDIIEKM